MPGGRILKYDYKVLLVTVTGETPKLAGWSLVAKVEYIEDERLICCVPGESCPEEFRTRGTECDHCKYQRTRKERLRSASRGWPTRSGRTYLHQGVLGWSFARAVVGPSYLGIFGHRSCRGL